MVKVKKQRTKRPPPADDDAALLNGMGNISLSPSSSSATSSRSDFEPCLTGLPYPVLRNISNFLLAEGKFGTVSALTRTSQQLHRAVTPFLYADVMIQEGRWLLDSGEKNRWEEMFEMKEKFSGMRKGKHGLDADRTLMDPLDCIKSLTIVAGNTTHLSDIYKLLSSRSHNLHTLIIRLQPCLSHIDQILFPEPKFPMLRLAKLDIDVSIDHCLGCSAHAPQRIAPMLATPFLRNLSLTLDPRICDIWLAQATGHDSLGRQLKKLQPDPKARFENLKVLNVVTSALYTTTPIRFVAMCCPNLDRLSVEAVPAGRGFQALWSDVVDALNAAVSVTHFDLTVGVDAKPSSSSEFQAMSVSASFPSRSDLLSVFRDVRKTRRNFSTFVYKVRSASGHGVSSQLSDKSSTIVPRNSTTSRNDALLHTDWADRPFIATFTAEWASGTGQIVATCCDLDAPERELAMIAAGELVEDDWQGAAWERTLRDTCV